MTTGKTIFRLILIVILIGAIAALGAFAYRSGVTYGLAQNVDWEAAQGGTSAYHPMIRSFPYRAAGFGLFHFLGGLFFFFLFIGLLRMIFFPFRHYRHFRAGGFHGGVGPGRCWNGKAVPPMVEDWHRRMHEEKSDSEDQKQEGAA